MDAKTLFKKHLEIHNPKGVYMSSKQLEQAHYNATIGAIEEALAYVPEPVVKIREDLERESLLLDIKRILNKVGEFDMSHDAIQGENTIIVNQIDITTTEIFGFNYGNVDCDIYVNDVESNSCNYLYSELSDEILREILYLIEMVEVDYDKTYKRIN